VARDASDCGLTAETDRWIRSSRLVRMYEAPATGCLVPDGGNVGDGLTPWRSKTFKEGFSISGVLSARESRGFRSVTPPQRKTDF